MLIKSIVRKILPLTVVALCLFNSVLVTHSSHFREFQAALLSVQWMMLACLSLWFGAFIYLSFSPIDWPLVVMLLIGIVHFIYAGATSPRLHCAVILLAGATLGRGIRLALEEKYRWQIADCNIYSEIGNRKRIIIIILFGFVGLLAFSAWWHLDMSKNYYHGPRWTGLWSNPNIYGMLMGACIVLTSGLLLADNRWKMDDRRKKAQNGKIKVETVFLFIAGGMVCVGLVMSYSRGAFLSTAIGLLYLAWSYSKISWRLLLPIVFTATALIVLLWHTTADDEPWYLKRLDFSRPSAQHRVSAWLGAVQMMRDHPLGVGCNQAVSVYDNNYSPPEGGAPALTTNSYLMLGTELGLPVLLCFVAYVALRLGFGRWKLGDRIGNAETGKRKMGSVQQIIDQKCDIGNELACRAGALVFVIAFWFDGGLFDLPTAAMFWVLLEITSINEREHNSIT